MSATSPRSPPPSSSASSSSQSAHRDLLNNPFENRDGRRFLRNLSYPLPVDLAELQRQTIRTLLMSKVFGRPVCSPNVHRAIPQRVLEVGCGSGYWSATCHDYFRSLGHENVSFTGVDVAALAPDLSAQGMRWRFVQHDLRRLPWPFEDEEFDLVMLKDLSLVFSLGTPSQKLMDESLRVLRDGGTLEVWESDHVLRSLQVRPPKPPRQDMDEIEVAAKTATYLASPGTPFVPVGNAYLRDGNTWISEALSRLRMPPAPCVEIARVLYQEPDSLGDIGSRRIAIPLSEQRWEREPGDANDSPLSQKGKAKVGSTPFVLTPDQAALRYTALLSHVQMLESLELALRDVSGKNAEEWGNWWASMMRDLLGDCPSSTSPRSTTLTGECLEIGAWWATKLER